MRRTSSLLLAAALAIAIVASALTVYVVKRQRDFSEPTAVAMGSVVSKSGKPRRGPDEGVFCWVSYEFTPPGGTAQRGWGMWRLACGLDRGRPIPIEYVVANPAVNRPPGGGPPIPPLLLWFAAGVLAVIGAIRRGSETDT